MKGGAIETGFRNPHPLGGRTPGCVRRRIHESHRPDRSRPCPSAAFFHRSRAASSWGLRVSGSGGRLISPISTFLSASLLFLSASLLNLGDLSGRAAGRTTDGRGGLAWVESGRRSCPRRLWAFSARL